MDYKEYYTKQKEELNKQGIPTPTIDNILSNLDAFSKTIIKEKITNAIDDFIANYEVKNLDDVSLIEDYEELDGFRVADLSYYDEQELKDQKIEELERIASGDFYDILNYVEIEKNVIWIIEDDEELQDFIVTEFNKGIDRWNY